MIQTWMADVTPLHDRKIYEKYYKEVPLFRQQKADRFCKQEDRALSVGAWVLLQKMREAYGLQDDAVYNLSHSGECVLCSVETECNPNRKLGCDIEKIQSPRENVAERFFCESECQTIRELCHSERTIQFYRLWVLKESFLKATRMGLKLDMKSYEIGFAEGDKPYLARQPKEFPERYFFQEYMADEVPYRICVCADCETFSAEICVVQL